MGYLRPIKQWNPGKQAEFDMRKTYKTLDQTIHADMGAETTFSGKLAGAAPSYDTCVNLDKAPQQHVAK